jgi:hypothetical protein
VLRIHIIYSFIFHYYKSNFMITKQGSLFAKLLFGVFVSITFIACSSVDAPAKTTFNLSGTATGAQEVPAFSTTATGTVGGTYDISTHLLTYTVSWTGLSGTANAAHFHGPADPGVNAPVLIPITITNNAATGTGSGSVTIADSVANFFLNGKMYFNVHTTLKPGGEIRAQVALQ